MHGKFPTMFAWKKSRIFNHMENLFVYAIFSWFLKIYLGCAVKNRKHNDMFDLVFNSISTYKFGDEDNLISINPRICQSSLTLVQYLITLKYLKFMKITEDI